MISLKPGFLGLIRLQNDTAVFVAYSYNVTTRTTTGLLLQTDEAEMTVIKNIILNHPGSMGHEFLLRIVLTEISLVACGDHSTDVKQDVMDIEHSTGQHTWHNYTARDEIPKTDGELSRATHGLRIQVATIHRKIEVVWIWIEQLIESLARDGDTAVERDPTLEWVQNMKTQAKMARIDADFIAKRAENQVGAVRNSWFSPHLHYFLRPAIVSHRIELLDL